MRVEYLDYFVAVVDYGTINRAANALFISPQGLSQAIQKLEQELDVCLFYREGSRLTLTAAGEKAYGLARMIGEQSRELLQAMEEYRLGNKTRMTDKLNIMASPAINATFLPKILIQMRKRYPGLRISVHEVDTEKMMNQTEKLPDTVYLFSTPEPVHAQMMKDSPEYLNYYELFRTPLMACVSSKSSLAKRSSLTWKDFNRRPLVLYQVEDRLIRMFDIDLDLSQIMLRSGDLSMCRTILSVEENSIGFSNRIEDRYIKMSSLVSVPLEPAVNILIGCFLDPERRADPLIQEFMNLITEELQNG